MEPDDMEPFVIDPDVACFFIFIGFFAAAEVMWPAGMAPLDMEPEPVAPEDIEPDDIEPEFMAPPCMDPD
jgi:hypothetical protein